MVSGLLSMPSTHDLSIFLHNTVVSKTKWAEFTTDVLCSIAFSETHLFPFQFSSRSAQVYSTNGNGQMDVTTLSLKTKHRLDSSLTFVELFCVSEDVLCSMYPGGNIIMWLGSPGVVLETFNVFGSTTFDKMRKLNDIRIAVVKYSNLTRRNSILVLDHMKGRAMKTLMEIQLRNSCYIKDLHGNGSVVVSVGFNGTAEIWRYLTGSILASFKAGKNTDLVEVSREFIACVIRRDGILRLHGSTGDYKFLGSIDFNKHLPGKRPYTLAGYIQNVIF